MEACASDARAVAESKFGIHLDGSFESIQGLERILAIQHASIPRGWKRWFRKGPADDVIHRFTYLWGGYLGEIFRQRHGGAWTIPDDGPMAGFACLEVSGTILSPQAKVAKRLQSGAEDNVWLYSVILDRELEQTGRAPDADG